MEILKLSQRVAQDCTSQVPVIVLGSGASAPHGIPGMGALGKHLASSVIADSLGTIDLKGWDDFKDKIQTLDLESALTEVTLSPSLTQHIVRTTWTYLNSADIAVFQEITGNRKLLPLTKLFQHLFNSTATELQVVTPNYDRLAEYAAEAAGYYAYTGFSFGMLGNRAEVPKITVRGKPQRTVNVWKVHGSFSWFQDRDGVVVSLPPSTGYSTELEPLIVTPGIEKYRRTHGEPFRTTMQSADRAITDAGAFLCIGYGFNDEHLQPLLVQRCNSRKVPLVLLTQKISDKAHEFLRSGKCQRYLAMEECERGTMVFSNERPEGEELPGRSVWKLDKFLELIM
ncbi:SIR2 family protein [Noviherbaspirillum aerium]|uniref:SIR2 family protein n=1 Tax=Noviherbaspirillum aerium TaxID=2588497 RepID=UPI00124DF9C7|nr:SIR2 family protein [Noviherbaspirillum aerium]